MSLPLQRGQPPATKHCTVSFPDPRVLLVTINRPRSLNSLTVEASNELDGVFKWFDAEEGFRVAIITGAGKAFCVGADLKEWMNNNKNGIPLQLPESGFAGLSFRQGKKPVIAAVNGPAFGGGCELAVNCDLVVAAHNATFALPEVKRGVTPFGGALPRLVSIVGRQRANELALTGRAATAEELREWGLCNAVTKAGEDVVAKALEYAQQIAGNSPDAMIVTREGLKMGWESLSIADAGRLFLDGWSKRIYDGPNMQEGLDAFVQKRAPLWKDSKL